MAAGNELKARALRHLARREHSRAELEKKLAPYGEADAISTVLDRMQELGLLSDRRFAESYVRNRAERLGRRRLEYELARRGIDAGGIEAALTAELTGDELTRARLLWQKKFGLSPEDGKEWARQARFLTSRGFSADVIRNVLREPFDESA